MAQSYPVAKPKIVWKNIIFFAFTAAVGILGGAYYLQNHILSPAIMGLTVFYMMASGMGITAGYHRLFSHVTYKAHPVIEFLMLFFGSAAFEQSALDWSSQHRDHHHFVDTDHDPYSIKKGFFYAHMGWLMFWEHTINFDNVQDLQKNKLVMHQHNNYLLWAAVSGIITPTLIGWALGDALGAFIFAVCLRITIVYQATFCINSVCHMFGKATYDIYATAKDHWLVALITNGEGYHNFHHRFPNDFRNGVRWYQWDPSKWLIMALASVGLTRDLKTVSHFRILEAKLKAERLQTQDGFKKIRHSLHLDDLRREVEVRYKSLCDRLFAWEERTKLYKNQLCGKIKERSSAVVRISSLKTRLAKKQFKQELRRWQGISRNVSSMSEAGRS